MTLTGFMGSGKSRTGKELARLLGWEFVDLDRYIEHKAGKSIAEIFEADSEEYFRALEAEAVRDLVTMRQITGESLVLSLGGGTIMTGAIRPLILEQTFCVYLQTSLDTVLGRVGGRNRNRPMLQGKYRTEELLDARTPVYEMAALTVRTDGRTPEEVAAEIFESMKKLR